MTAWAYLFVYSDHFGTRKAITEFLDSIPEITHWYYCLPHCIFFTSTLGAHRLADKVYDRFGKSARFMIAEVHKDREGWLPQNAWHMFRDPGNPRLKD